MKVLMTGATGMVGREIGKALARAGHKIVIVARDRESAKRDCPFPCEIVEGNLVAAPVSSHFLDEVEGVVHLMGEPIAKGRWTDEKKKRLIESRVQATKNLRLSLAGRAKVVVSTSAVGIYGDRADEVLTEDSAPGSDFLAKLCQDWEAEAKAFEKEGARVVCLRLGMVLSNRGGALGEMLPAARAGVAGPLGGGEQWMSWIHIEDVVRLYLKALTESNFRGSYNAVAPEVTKNKDFMNELTKLLNRPGFLPVPRLGLKVLFGEMSTVLLSSQRASSEKAQAVGFQFQFPQLKGALEDQLGHLARGEDLFIAEQYIEQSPEEIFPFFSKAENLGKITPDFLDFKVLSVSESNLQEGSLIDYRIKIHGVPVRWKTRIEEWIPGKKFVDLQIKGPYKLWHHTHQFEKMGTGTLMTDQVRFQLPLGYPGWLVANAFVQKDVGKIFEYRRKVISELY